VRNINNPASVAGALQNLLGGSPSGAQGQQPSNEHQPQQQNPVQQIMGIFGKKKNQEQPPK
jgi:hypothetical protein